MRELERRLVEQLQEGDMGVEDLRLREERVMHLAEDMGKPSDEPWGYKLSIGGSG